MVGPTPKTATIEKSGAIWRRPRRARESAVSAVCRMLAKSYPACRLGNPRDPVADLVYITISNRTTPEQAASVYKRLRSHVGRWDDLLVLRQSTIKEILRPAGLNAIKAAFLVGLARALRDRFGRVTLRPLRRMTDAERLQLLTSLPGVSGKVARCVMMYCFDSAVLPVDVHVHRLATRLGWTSRKRADQSHDELEALVPPQKRMRFHVDAIQHSRAVCAATMPRCSECVLQEYCRYWRAR